MLKLKKVQVGVFPDSQMQGMPVIHFELEKSSDAYELDAEGHPTQDSRVKCAEKILEDIRKELEANHWEEEWVDFLLAKKYGVFTGNEMAAEDEVDTSDVLFRMISHISHDMQNDIEEVEFRKRPPMFVFKGEPIYYTGLKQFYENFNVVFCRVDANALPENMFALLEMQKHTFCNIEAICNNAEDVENFYNNYLANDQIQADPNRTTALLIDKDSDAAVKKAAELKVRVIASLRAITKEALDI